ncbi:unnamed protein product [Sphagnum jensenii]|uniref:Regulator of chromosome condensation n=1 Tax=Sphagnum jensenii TaxID=128206 RepID=A0ABP1B9K7_9BRYO
MAAKAQVLSEAKKNEDEEPKAGELLFCGGSNWEAIGKKQTDGGARGIFLPTRLAALQGIDIAFVASGSASCHCIALDVNGRCFTWGRNEKGQLGLGDFSTRSSPTVVTALSKYKVVRAAAGRAHTVVVTSKGESLAFGFNKHGQLGAGFVKEESEKSPVRSLVTDATFVACGAEFTIWLTSIEGATVMSAGLPQYGQLGHGTDNEYNSKEGSVRLVYEAQPRPRAISSLATKTVIKVACGNNHSVAVDSGGFVYTWGFGGHGRLGHKEQKDEWTPRVVETFQRANVLPPNALVAAGSAYSAATAAGGQLYMWGRVKTTGDNWMYPKPVLDLSGWSIRSLDCGNTTSLAAAEESCISWGTALYGELGYGPTGPKSSANPKKIDALEGLHVIRVACGLGHSAFIVDRSKAPEKFKELEVFEAEESIPVDEEEMDEEVEEAPEKKRKAAGRGRGKPSKKKAQSESDEDESDDDSDKPKAKGGRGRGKGRGSGTSKAATRNGAFSDDGPPTKKGRGRSGAAVAASESALPARGRARGRGRGK